MEVTKEHVPHYVLRLTEEEKTNLTSALRRARDAFDEDFNNPELPQGSQYYQRMRGWCNRLRDSLIRLERQ